MINVYWNFLFEIKHFRVKRYIHLLIVSMITANFGNIWEINDMFFHPNSMIIEMMTTETIAKSFFYVTIIVVLMQNFATQFSHCWHRIPFEFFASTFATRHLKRNSKLFELHKFMLNKTHENVFSWEFVNCDILQINWYYKQKLYKIVIVIERTIIHTENSSDINTRIESSCDK